MAPYSLDLRERIVAARLAGDAVRDVAERFGVGTSTVGRLVRRYRRTGTLTPKAHAGGIPRAIEGQAETMLDLIARERPSAGLADLAEELHRRTGVRVGRVTVWRSLSRLGWCRKKRGGKRSTRRKGTRVGS